MVFFVSFSVFPLMIWLFILPDRKHLDGSKYQGCWLVLWFPPQKTHNTFFFFKWSVLYRTNMYVVQIKVGLFIWRRGQNCGSIPPTLTWGIFVEQNPKGFMELCLKATSIDEPSHLFKLFIYPQVVSIFVIKIIVSRANSCFFVAGSVKQSS